MAKFDYRFPELGEGLHEGEIINICVKPGDKITDEDIIMEVRNDKAIVEVPCPVNGTVLEVKVKNGQICRMGEVVALIDAEDDIPEQMTAENEAEEQSAVLALSMDSAMPAKTDKTYVLATPSVRKLARELGVDLVEVPATGRNGKITREDVEAFAKHERVDITNGQADCVKNVTTTTDTAVISKTERAGEEERIPYQGIRKAIANAMVKSAYTAPHVTIMDEVEVGALVAFRTRMKPMMDKKGTKITYLPFIIKSLIAACRNYPVMNAMLDEANNELVYKKYYHIGIAADTDKGLIVPVIRDADRRSIWMLANDIKDLAHRGREGKLNPNELKGSTITITNIGSAGGMFFTPIINFPEVAILGTGRIYEKPVVKNGEVIAAPVMAMSLSFDHRIIDGATAQSFMNEIKQLLANPELLMMEV